jgi:hypothetical protein
MKKLFLLTALAVAVLGKAAFAADFPITAVIPAATTVKFVVSEVTPGPTPVFVSHPSFSLDFSTAGTGMSYDLTNGIWVGSRFFAIDLATTKADGTPAPGTYGSVSFSYGGNVVPAGQGASEGLNKRATLTAVKVNSDSTETSLRKGAIGNAFASLTNADVAGGFLRVYVGLATGETGANAIPGSVPFTNADKPGTYTGTLTITATLI